MLLLAETELSPAKGKGRGGQCLLSFVVQRIKMTLSGHFSGCLFVWGIGVWLPGLVHCSFATVASASRVFEFCGCGFLLLSSK